jgi:hypothetical protein
MNTLAAEAIHYATGLFRIAICLVVVVVISAFVHLAIAVYKELEL